MSLQSSEPNSLSPQSQPQGIYTRLLKYLRPYRREFMIAMLCMVVFGASDGIVPFLVKNLLDGVFAAQNQKLLYVLPVVLMAFALVRAVVDFGQQFLIARIGHRIVRDFRNQLNSHMLTLSPDFYVRNQTGNLLSRITSDVVLVRMVLTESVSSILRDSIRVVALLVAAIYLDPVLAGIAVIAVPLGIWPIYKFGRKLRKLSKRGQEAIGSLSVMLQESMLGNRVVKIFGREAYEQQRFEKENEQLTATFVKSERVRATTGPINEVLATLAISGVLLYGGYSVIGGVRSQGEFIAFLMSVFLLYDPFKRLGRVHSSIQQGVAGAERIFEILDTQPSVREPHRPIKLTDKNGISFENVSFSYGRDEQRALNDINLYIPEGKKVALVGFSGAGKSTLVDLIPRFIDPQQGQVSIGGVDVSKVSLCDLRARIAMVGQHTFLFNDTIYNNIQYGNPLATRNQVEEAARAAYALDFIQQLPKGFESVVGEGGYALSGGERQRLAIARAILKNAPILILDEATASLDNRAEREVQSAIEVLEKNRTSVVIAHRLSTVREADLIVVLRDGRIVETGRHEEMLKNKDGEYAKLYALQFAASEDKGDAGEIVIN